jgi:hypothetical protein
MVRRFPSRIRASAPATPMRPHRGSSAPKCRSVPVSPSILALHLPTAPQILVLPRRRRYHIAAPPSSPQSDPRVRHAAVVVQVPFPRGVNCHCLSVPSRPYLLATGQKGEKGANRVSGGDSAGPLCLRWPGRRQRWRWTGESVCGCD